MRACWHLLNNEGTTSEIRGKFKSRCLKEKDELQGMLPVEQQLENVKGELFKLTRIEAGDCQLWHNMTRTEERKNKETAYCQTWHNMDRREESKKQKNREIAD
ncbi:hypothetical protein AVEN_133319-1 [Araneus ventricosus]|uniref:Uncharacterized protein n=1 Tax=Araneus ventricosus TaxID=182803 RepID=A0A4Y2DJU5_ARAVE|nr:hypothetical protein AVEN_133319-1 [Araneus ventricosus]